MTNMLLQFLFILASIFFVILFITLGWYMVWKFFLCRFRLVRELFSLNSKPPPAENDPRRSGGTGGRSSTKETTTSTTSNSTTTTQRRGNARKSS